MTTLRVFPDASALARAAADELATITTEAIAARGICHVALSGGTTPRRMFEELAARGPDALPWKHVELWWGDERAVPPDHPDSNYAMTRRTLLAPLAIEAARVHRIPAEEDPDAGALAYEHSLIASLGTPPVFDLVFLGLGRDGHTASLFPDTAALDETKRWVVANRTAAGVRITLTLGALAEARHLRFLVEGADKAEILARVLGDAGAALPAQRVVPRHGDLVWFADAAAAAAAR